MTIKPDFVDSDRVKVIKQKNILSKRIQELVDRKKEPDSDLKIVIPEIKTVTIPFKKSQKQIAHPKSLFFTTHTHKRKTSYSTIIMNTLKSLASSWKIQQLISNFD